MITFEQLRVFQAIVAHGTFRAAARALHKSQPALSTMIRNLEEQCGFALFSRDTYRPQLTREGRVFYDRAVATLREMGRLNALAGRLSGKEEPALAIAINTIYCLKPLLQTLKDIDETYPATQLNVTTETLGGADSLYSTVQMPSGVPVACVAIGSGGAINAGIFAAQILGLTDPEVAEKLVAKKRELQEKVAEKNRRVQEKVKEARA